MSINGIKSLLTDDDEPDCELDPELVLQSVLSNPGLLQQISRTRVDGVETFVGYFRAEFLPNQKRHVLHIPFVPAFDESPEVELHASDHEDVRIRMTDCQKFGLRLEVILAQPNESSQSRLIEVIASHQNISVL